jgi:anti-sigma factor RsiW
MQCPRLNGRGAELMMAYTAGTLEPEVQIELERHVSSCEGCREMAAQQKAVWEALDDWRPAPVSADFNDRLYQRIAAEEAAGWWRRPFQMDWSWMFRPAVPVAGACAALMIAFLLKEPVAPRHSTTPLQHKVTIEQVERALDDMDMLKQMSVTGPAEGQATERI